MLAETFNQMRHCQPPLVYLLAGECSVCLRMAALDLKAQSER